MAFATLKFSRSRFSCLSILFIVIACLAGFASALQAQTAHFSGAVRTPGGTKAEANRKALAAQIGMGALPNDIQTTHGDFGPVNVGSSSTSPIAMVFTFDAAVTLGSTAVLTQGATDLDFTDAGGDTCTPNTAYNAGGTCTINVTFKPRYPGVRYGAAELLDTSGNLLANGYVQGTGVGPQVTFANSTSGVYLPGTQTTLDSPFSYPAGITVDSSGNVFVADRQKAAVTEVLAAGGYTTVKTLGTGFFYPFSVAVDGSGNVFVADSANKAVKEILAAGGYTTIKTLGSGFSYPVGVAVDGSGNVFVADHDRSVKEIVAADGYTTVKTLYSGSGDAASVAVDGIGNVFVIFVGAWGSGTVKEIVAAGGYTTVKTLASGIHHFDTWYVYPGIAVDGIGNVFYSESGDDDKWYSRGSVKEIVAAGGYATIKTLADHIYYLNGLALDGSGNVFYCHGESFIGAAVTRLDYADPPSLDFIGASVGVQSSNSPQTVTVSNTGNADLTFPIPTADRNPGISSGFTLDSATTCPDLSVSSATGTLAAGASCLYAVDFTPAALESYSGSLTLSDNSLNATPSATQAIPLTGTGIEPHLAFTTPPPAKLDVGQGPGTVAVSVEDSRNNVMTASSATITLTVAGPNSYAKVYTATASSGTATFSSLALLSTVGSYSYTATDTPDGLTQAVATESVFAPHLAFTTPPPANLQVGHAPGTVAVSVEDANNNVMTTSSATVTLTVTGPNSYDKVYTATASSGIATFTSLESLHTLGSYSYTATDVPDGLTQTVATESVFALPPFGAIGLAVDSVTFSTTVAQSGSLLVNGWAADPQDGSPVADVKVYIDWKLIGTPQLGILRPDVAAKTNNDAYILSGFHLVHAASSLSLGTHQVTVAATDSYGKSVMLGLRYFTVAAAAAAGAPFGQLGLAVDSVTFSTTVGQSDSLMVKGWVADPQDGAPLSNVAVYIDGTSIGTPTLGIARSDVAAVRGNAYFHSGYQLLYPAASLALGTHQVTVVAVDSGGRSTTFGPRTFTVAATAGLGSPFGAFKALDSVTSSTTVSQADSLKVTGWVADPQDGAPLSNVKVYVDGTSIGTPTLGISRPDVAAAYGSAYLNSGYKLLYPASSLSLGEHVVTVVAVDSGGRSTTLEPRIITVQ
jgi:hypothetical protein